MTRPMNLRFKPVPLLLSALLLSTLSLIAQTAGSDASQVSSPVLEKEVAAILNRMTLEEKAAMCVGAGNMDFKGVPQLGVPNMTCDDGPRGLHGGSATAFHVGVAFGATWNPELIEQAAESWAWMALTVAVSNTGKVAGADTVQLYIREIKPVLDRPIHELKSFQKISLLPGETKEIAFHLHRFQETIHL